MKILYTILQAAEQQVVNPADSALVALKGAARELAQDPSGFVTGLWQQAINFGLKLLAAIAIYVIGAWLIKRIRRILLRFFERKGSEPTLSSFVTSLVTIMLTVLLIIATIGALGINTTSFAAILAAGGMAIGMALSGTVQNFAGGLMILLFKPFKVGDYIKAQGYEGFVTEVSIVSTKIRTYANSIIVLPNGALFNGNIDNFSEKRIHRISWTVSTAYGTDPSKVREVILGLLSEDERIIGAETPGAADPSVKVDKLNDSSVDFVVYAWVNTGDFWPVTYDINEKIYTELPKNGISFPFPQLDIHMVNSSRD